MKVFAEDLTSATVSFITKHLPRAYPIVSLVGTKKTPSLIGQPSGPRSRVSMADIARVAGVHRSTVSLALRHHTRIPAATRERIMKVVATLGYAPDPMLDAFNFHRLTTHPKRGGPAIAFISDMSSRKAFDEATMHHLAYEGARQRATELGLRVDLFLVGPGQLKSERLDQILQARGISCLLIGFLKSETCSLNLDWPRYCAIAIESFQLQPKLDSITLDHRMIVRKAAQHLHAKNHRRIGFISTREEDDRLMHLPLSGYLLECGRDRPSIVPPLIAHRLTDLAFPEQFEAWLDQHRPSAVIAGCLFTQEALQNGSLRLPKRFAKTILATGSLQINIESHGKMGAQAVEFIYLRQQVNQRGVTAHRSTIVLPVSDPAAVKLSHAVPT